MGQVPAGNQHDAASQLRCSPDDQGPQPLVILRGSAGQADSQNLKVPKFLLDKIKGNHGTVVQEPFPLSQGAGIDALFIGFFRKIFPEFFVVFCMDFHLPGSEPAEITGGGFSRRDMEIVFIGG